MAAPIAPFHASDPRGPGAPITPPQSGCERRSGWLGRAAAARSDPRAGAASRRRCGAWRASVEPFRTSVSVYSRAKRCCSSTKGAGSASRPPWLPRSTRSSGRPAASARDARAVAARCCPDLISAFRPERSFVSTPVGNGATGGVGLRPKTGPPQGSAVGVRTRHAKVRFGAKRSYARGLQDRRLRARVGCRAADRRTTQDRPGKLRLRRSPPVGQADPGMRATTLISKSKPASQFTPTAVQFG